MQPDKILIPFIFNFLLTRNKWFIFMIFNTNRKMLRSQTSRSLTRKSWRQCLTSSVGNLSWYRHYFAAHLHCSKKSRSKIWNIRDTCHYQCILPIYPHLQTLSLPSMPHPLAWAHSWRWLQLLTTLTVSPSWWSRNPRVSAITWTVRQVS